MRNNGALLRAGLTNPSITWIGHATTLVQVGGWNVLTDPVFGSLPFIPRRAKPGVPFDALPPLDVVLVSHDHRDHLEEETVRRIGDRAVFVVPLGIGPWLRARGVPHVIELDWWQSVEIADPAPGTRPPLRITLVPARHWAQRCLDDWNRRLWAGFVIEGPLSIYFAGDTGYGPHFRRIAARFPHLDLAILPIGAYEPRGWLALRHESPEEAAQAFRDLGARWVVPIHWGTFRLGEEPLGEPPLRFAAALGADARRSFVLPIGGILRLPPPVGADRLRLGEGGTKPSQDAPGHPPPGTRMPLPRHPVCRALTPGPRGAACDEMHAPGPRISKPDPRRARRAGARAATGCGGG